MAERRQSSMREKRRTDPKRWEPIPEAEMRVAIDSESCPCELAARDTTSMDWSSTADEVVRFGHRSGAECEWRRDPPTDTWKPTVFNREAR
jgi:hypothetical protein